MDLLKFSILKLDENLPSKYKVTPILLNIAHVVSIKPINIVVSANVIKGYWVRLSNGKKYKMVDIPPQIVDLFELSTNSSKPPIGNRNIDSELLMQ